MEPFEFKCRAKDMEHSCRYKNVDEPDHDPSVLKSFASIKESTELMLYKGRIKSPANSYQIDLEFDQSWINCMNDAGWKVEQLQNLGNLTEIPHIQPDAILGTA